jgi:beta-aspartyl-dipeptidase (metallo-type)
MIILHHGNIVSPEWLGIKSVIISENRILQIVDPSMVEGFVKAMKTVGVAVDVQDCSGYFVCPGLIDAHVHLTGGGGELGARSRTPEAQVSELVRAGLTTVIGLLGTDGITRSLENLYQKVMGLREEGLNAFMFTGGYRVPVGTITESIQRDLILIDPVIGVGEIALSDHRGTYASSHTLYQQVSDSRVGGLLSGKGGVVQVHVGAGKKGLAPLLDIVEETDIPITQFHPTHVSSRGPQLLEEIVEWLARGGSADVTADEPGYSDTVEALDAWRKESFLERVTVSSDAYGFFKVHLGPFRCLVQMAHWRNMQLPIHKRHGSPSNVL